MAGAAGGGEFSAGARFFFAPRRLNPLPAWSGWLRLFAAEDFGDTTDDRLVFRGRPYHQARPVALDGEGNVVHSENSLKGLGSGPAEFIGLF